jgi:hypothetical protein
LAAVRSMELTPFIHLCDRGRDDRNWPTAEMPAADRHGRLLAYCGRHRGAIGMVG